MSPIPDQFNVLFLHQNVPADIFLNDPEAVAELMYVTSHNNTAKRF